MIGQDSFKSYYVKFFIFLLSCLVILKYSSLGVSFDIFLI